MCKETLAAEGCGEEEINEEMAALLVQEGYVLQMKREYEKAVTLYAQVLNSK